ncbi:hypothetical protein BX616_011259 [Lobosporangium transversale]|nr:hypothetical protein BX616_011259 [Lobosporangium transversale]
MDNIIDLTIPTPARIIHPRTLPSESVEIIDIPSDDEAPPFHLTFNQRSGTTASRWNNIITFIDEHDTTNSASSSSSSSRPNNNNNNNNNNGATNVRYDDNDDVQIVAEIPGRSLDPSNPSYANGSSTSRNATRATTAEDLPYSTSVPQSHPLSFPSLFDFFENNSNPFSRSERPQQQSDRRRPSESRVAEGVMEHRDRISTPEMATSTTAGRSGVNTGGRASRRSPLRPRTQTPIGRQNYPEHTTHPLWPDHWGDTDYSDPLFRWFHMDSLVHGINYNPLTFSRRPSPPRYHHRHHHRHHPFQGGNLRYRHAASDVNIDEYLARLSNIFDSYITPGIGGRGGRATSSTSSDNESYLNKPAVEPRPGYTKSLNKNVTIACPICQNELGHAGKENTKLWVLVGCGHVICDECIEGIFMTKVAIKSKVASNAATTSIGMAATSSRRQSISKRSVIKGKAKWTAPMPSLAPTNGDEQYMESGGKMTESSVNVNRGTDTGPSTDGSGTFKLVKRATGQCPSCNRKIKKTSVQQLYL